MASQGPNICGTGADDATVGSIAWTNPTRITALDSSYATAAVLNLNDQTHYIKGSNFGFTVPTSSTIEGVKFGFRLSMAALFAGTVVVISAKAGKGGTIGGSEKAASETLTTTDTWIEYGGVADLCGLTLAAADVNASNFLAVASLQLTVPAAGTCQCDACRCSITYTDLTTPGVVFIQRRELHFAEFLE